MDTIWHILAHLGASFFAGLLVWKIWKKLTPSLLATLTGGFLIDADHLIDYFLAFGWKFNLHYFFSGYQFLKNDRLYIIFHGWEYVVLLIIIVFLIKSTVQKSLFLGLALGLLFHLCLDVWIDHLPVSSYFLTYRVKNNFLLEKLVFSDHWQKHQQKKKIIKFN